MQTCIFIHWTVGGIGDDDAEHDDECMNKKRLRPFFFISVELFAGVFLPLYCSCIGSLGSFSASSSLEVAATITIARAPAPPRTLHSFRSKLSVGFELYECACFSLFLQRTHKHNQPVAVFFLLRNRKTLTESIETYRMPSTEKKNCWSHRQGFIRKQIHTIFLFIWSIAQEINSRIAGSSLHLIASDIFHNSR